MLGLKPDHDHQDMIPRVGLVIEANIDPRVESHVANKFQQKRPYNIEWLPIGRAMCLSQSGAGPVPTSPSSSMGMDEPEEGLEDVTAILRTMERKLSVLENRINKTQVVTD